MAIAIMQGRLLPPTDGHFQSFPRERWPEEFALAAAAGIAALEWIYDLPGAEANPIASDDGVARMQALSAEHGVLVRSICADFFIARPLVRASAQEIDDRIATLMWLLDRGAKLGLERIVLPFVDASKIDTDEELADVTSTLIRVIPTLEMTGVELHLETSLAPLRFAELLARVGHPMVKVNYDSGNSSSLGYRPVDEFAAYGTRVGSVHIKDRVLGGGTVPLGSGDTDFTALVRCLASVAYRGDYVLQAARGEPGDELAWARHNVAFVEALQAGIA